MTEITTLLDKACLADIRFRTITSALELGLIDERQATAQREAVAESVGFRPTKYAAMTTADRGPEIRHWRDALNR